MGGATDAETPKRNTESVLFVDDEKHILSSLKRLVKPLKLNVYTAESGKLGLEILAEHKVDLIVSDMRMPEMDGVETTRALLDRHGSRRPPPARRRR